MNRITITPDIEAQAEVYASQVAAQISAVNNLNKLKVNIDNGSYKILNTYRKDNKTHRHHKTKDDFCKYLQKIINEYHDLLVKHPKAYLQTNREFESIIPSDVLTVKLSFYVCKRTKVKKGNKRKTKKRVKKSFFELIVEAMDYQKIQSTIFPKIMRDDMNIRTCVYCNAQFAIAADEKTALYQLDHVWPKSKYPYLSTSFFNLQPCCGSCNQRKSYIDFLYGKDGKYNLSIWKEPGDEEPDYFHFHLDDEGLSTYLEKMSKHDSNLLKIKYQYDGNVRDLKKLHSKIEEKFHISDQYNQLKDVIEETVWRHQIYSPAYTTGLMKQFSLLFPDIKDQYKRLVKGRLIGEDTVYKRPLAQMMQDIDDQLDGIAY